MSIAGDKMSIKNIALVGLYRNGPTKQLTMKDMCREAKLNYRRTFPKIKDMIKKKIFIPQYVGRVTLCSFNIFSEEGIGLMVQAEIKAKESFGKQYTKTKVKTKISILNKDLVEGVTKASPSIRSIVVFGSYVKGEADERSDYDILVICDNKKDHKKIEKAIRAQSFQHGIKLQSWVMTTEMIIDHLREKEINVVKEAFRNHIILYGYESFWRNIQEASK